MRKVLWIPLVAVALLALGVSIALAWPKGTVQAQSPDQPRRGGFLGVQVVTISEALSRRLNLPVGAVVVVRVLPNSPAEQAGLQRGDVLTQAAVGTTTVTLQRPSDLTHLLRNAQPGDQVTLTVQRGQQTSTVTVTLGEWPQPLPRHPGLRPPWGGHPWPVLPPGLPRTPNRIVRGEVVLQNGTTTVTYTFFGGTVSATSTNAIVVTPLDGSAPVTVNLTNDVRVVGCARHFDPVISVGDRVVVVSQDGVVRWVIVVGPCRPLPRPTPTPGAQKSPQGTGSSDPIRILPIFPGKPDKDGPIQIQPVPQELKPQPKPSDSDIKGTGV